MLQHRDRTRETGVPGATAGGPCKPCGHLPRPPRDGAADRTAGRARRRRSRAARGPAPSEPRVEVRAAPARPHHGGRTVCWDARERRWVPSANTSSRRSPRCDRRPPAAGLASRRANASSLSTTEGSPPAARHGAPSAARRTRSDRVARPTAAARRDASTGGRGPGQSERARTSPLPGATSPPRPRLQPSAGGGCVLPFSFVAASRRSPGCTGPPASITTPPLRLRSSAPVAARHPSPSGLPRDSPISNAETRPPGRCRCRCSPEQDRPADVNCR